VTIKHIRTRLLSNPHGWQENNISNRVLFSPSLSLSVCSYVVAAAVLRCRGKLFSFCAIQVSHVICHSCSYFFSFAGGVMSKATFI
jgi:hypothetical protein